MSSRRLNLSVFIVGLILLTASAHAKPPFPGWNTLDLDTRMAWHAHMGQTIQPAEEHIYLFIKSTGPDAVAAHVRNQGGTVLIKVGSIIVVRIAVQQMRAMMHPAITRVERSKKMKPSLNRALPTIGANSGGVFGPGGVDEYDGSGVLVGVIDYDFDTNHNAFKSPSGQSRIVFKCKHDKKLDCTTPFDTEKESGHGTHVASIAAGSPWKDTQRTAAGIAPGSAIALVNYYLGDASVLKAAKQIFEYADSSGSPCVINISLGSERGPADGHSLFAEAINQLIERTDFLDEAAACPSGTQVRCKANGQGVKPVCAQANSYAPCPSRVIVAAAGNEGGNRSGDALDPTKPQTTKSETERDDLYLHAEGAGFKTIVVAPGDHRKLPGKHVDRLDIWVEDLAKLLANNAEPLFGFELKLRDQTVGSIKTISCKLKNTAGAEGTSFGWAGSEIQLQTFDILCPDYGQVGKLDVSSAISPADAYFKTNSQSNKASIVRSLLRLEWELDSSLFGTEQTATIQATESRYPTIALAIQSDHSWDAWLSSHEYPTKLRGGLVAGLSTAFVNDHKSVGLPALASRVLAIGASKNPTFHGVLPVKGINYQGLESEQVASYGLAYGELAPLAHDSSAGPTNNSTLLKPDYVAPGDAIAAAMSRATSQTDAGLITNYQSLCIPQIHQNLYDGSLYNCMPSGSCIADENLSFAAASNGYVMMSGTSMASPLVAGTVALLLQINESLSNTAIKSILKQTANRPSDMLESEHHYRWGWGQINARKAVTKAAFMNAAPVPKLCSSDADCKLSEECLASGECVETNKAVGEACMSHEECESYSCYIGQCTEDCFGQSRSIFLLANTGQTDAFAPLTYLSKTLPSGLKTIQDLLYETSESKHNKIGLGLYPDFKKTSWLASHGCSFNVGEMLKTYFPPANWSSPYLEEIIGDKPGVCPSELTPQQPDSGYHANPLLLAIDEIKWRYADIDVGAPLRDLILVISSPPSCCSKLQKPNAPEESELVETKCEVENEAENEVVEEVASLFSAGIRTHVIGLGPINSNTKHAQWLNKLAVAGGTAKNTENCQNLSDGAGEQSTCYHFGGTNFDNITNSVSQAFEAIAADLAKDRCDGVDTDCDGTVDEDANCGSGKVCQAGQCVGYGQSNNNCQSNGTCPGGEPLEDADCAKAGTCESGYTCQDNSACASGNCNNGVCCQAGADCCVQAADCPSSYAQEPSCNETQTCQGTRADRVCTTDFTCESVVVEDDSACTADVIADECGLYTDQRCLGQVEQFAPVCPSGCLIDGNCDNGAHCDPVNNTFECVPNLANGSLCDEQSDCSSGHCNQGFCCNSGHCNVLCYVSGQSGQSQSCHLAIARHTQNDPPAVSMELWLSYDPTAMTPEHLWSCSAIPPPAGQCANAPDTYCSSLVQGATCNPQSKLCEVCQTVGLDQTASLSTGHTVQTCKGGGATCPTGKLQLLIASTQSQAISSTWITDSGNLNQEANVTRVRFKMLKAGNHPVHLAVASPFNGADAQANALTLGVNASPQSGGPYVVTSTQAGCDPSTKGTCMASCNPVQVDGDACNDGDPCTQGDTCKDGLCIPGPPVNCTAPGQCYLSQCNPFNGSCYQSPQNNGALCDDGDPCTIIDHCQNGSCSGFTNPFCGGLELDLGSWFKQIMLALIPSGCYGGTVPVAVTWLPFDSVTAEACVNDNGDITSVTLDVSANLGPFGLQLWSGDWKESGSWYMGGSLPNVSLLGLNLTNGHGKLWHNANGSLSIDVGGKVAFGNTTLEWDGNLTLEDKWALDLKIGQLTLGGFELKDTVLSVGQDASQIELNADLIIGTGTYALPLTVGGQWTAPSAGNNESPDFDFSIGLSPGKTWTPFDGLTLGGIGGSLKKTGNDLALAVDIDPLGIPVAVDLPGLGSFAFGGTLFASGDNSPITGCLGADVTELNFPLPGSYTGLAAQACIEETNVPQKTALSLGLELTGWAPVPGFTISNAAINFSKAGAQWGATALVQGANDQPATITIAGLGELQAKGQLTLQKAANGSGNLNGTLTVTNASALSFLPSGAQLTLKIAHQNGDTTLSLGLSASNWSFGTIANLSLSGELELKSMGSQWHIVGDLDVTGGSLTNLIPGSAQSGSLKLSINSLTQQSTLSASVTQWNIFGLVVPSATLNYVKTTTSWTVSVTVGSPDDLKTINAGSFGNMPVYGNLEVSNNKVSGCLHSDGSDYANLLPGTAQNITASICFEEDKWDLVVSAIDWTPMPGLKLGTITAKYVKDGNTYTLSATAGTADQPMKLQVGPYGNVRVWGNLTVVKEGNAPPVVSGCIDANANELIGFIPGTFNTSTTTATFCFGQQAGVEFSVQIALKNYNVGGLSNLSATAKITKASGPGGVWDFAIHIDPITIPAGPLGNISVEGDLKLMEDSATGKAVIMTCLDVETAANALSSLGIQGAPQVSYCFDGTAYTSSIQLTLPSWAPAPGISFNNISAKVVYNAETQGWRLDVDAKKTAWDIGGLSIKNPAFAAEWINNTWVITVAGKTTFSLFGLATVNLDVEGTIDNDSVSFKSTLAGNFQPIPEVDFFSLTNPSIALDFSLANPTNINVTLAGQFTFNVFGNPLNLDISGGGDFTGQNIWFTGELSGENGGLSIPGFPAMNGNLCVGITKSKKDDVELCGLKVDLDPGFSLVTGSELPFQLGDEPTLANLVLNFKSLQEISISANIDFDWPLINSEGLIPGVKKLSISGLTLAADIDGPNFAISLSGETTMVTNLNDTVTGTALMGFNPVTTEIEAEIYTNGLWKEPFTLKHIATQNAGMSVTVAISTSGIPTAAAMNADFFWKKSGNWPVPVANNPEVCDDFVDNDNDGKTDCDDTQCKNKHVSCMSTIAKLGATLALDTVPSTSGICLGSACVPLPMLITRLEIKSIGTEDAFTLLNHVKDAVRSVVTEFNKLPGVTVNADSFLPEKAVEKPNLSPLDLKVNEASLYISTHSKTVMGVDYKFGFSATLDASLNSKNLKLHAAINKDGLLAEARMSPLSLWGLSLSGDPFAHEFNAKSNGYIQIPHSTRFNQNNFTIEGWVKRSYWPSSQPGAIFWKKSTTSNGVAIHLGDRQRVCNENGNNCKYLGRITVIIKKNGSTRTIVTENGVLPANERTHIAVVVKYLSVYTRRVDILVNGQRVETNDPSQIRPGTNSNNVTMGQLGGYGRVDDVRFWKSARTQEQIADSMLYLPNSAHNSNLIARYTFDFNSDLTTYNERYYTSQKLHGTLKNWGSAVSLPSELFFKFAVLPNNVNNSGVWLAAGAHFPNPLGGNPIKTRAALELTPSTLLGQVFAQKFTIFTIPNIGSLKLSGNGPNQRSDDYDDGMYGSIELIGSGSNKQKKMMGSASLLWESSKNNQTMAGGSFTLNCNANCSLVANGQVNQFPIWIPGVGYATITGAGSVNTQTKKLTISNAYLKIWGVQYPKGSMTLDKDKLWVSTKVTVPSLLGINFGQQSLSMTMNWSNPKLCGSFSHQQSANSNYSDGFQCNVGVCLSSSGVEPSLSGCGGVQPCLSDNDCDIGDEYCLGICMAKKGNGQLCTHPNQCSGGGCLGKCYVPNSKSEGQSCYAGTLDHCKSGMACWLKYGSNTQFKCFKLNLPQYAPCTHSDQCDQSKNLACKIGLSAWNVDVGICQKSNQSNGAKCRGNHECKSNNCKNWTLVSDGTCKCKDGQCGSGKYCHSNGNCDSLKNKGDNCSQDKQCGKSGGKQMKCNNWCYRPNDPNKGVGNSCVASDNCGTGTCKISYGKNTGKCWCEIDNHCGGTKFCNINAGTCDNGRSNGSNCKNNKWCIGNCGPLNYQGYGECYSSSQNFNIGSSCVHKSQCKGSNSTCATSTGWILKEKCKCTAHTDCGNGKYCQSGSCHNKKNDFSGCSYGYECNGGNCSNGWGKTGGDKYVYKKRCWTAGQVSNHQPCVTAQHCAGYDSSTRCGGLQGPYSAKFINHVLMPSYSIPTWLKTLLNTFGKAVPSFIKNLAQDSTKSKPFKCYKYHAKNYDTSCVAHDECKSDQCGKWNSSSRCGCRVNNDCTSSSSPGCDRNITSQYRNACRTPKKGYSNSNFFWCFSNSQCTKGCDRPNNWKWGLCK